MHYDRLTEAMRVLMEKDTELIADARRFSLIEEKLGPASK